MQFVIVDECDNIAISTHSNHESYLQLIDWNCKNRKKEERVYWFEAIHYLKTILWYTVNNVIEKQECNVLPAFIHHTTN